MKFFPYFKGFSLIFTVPLVLNPDPEPKPLFTDLDSAKNSDPYKSGSTKLVIITVQKSALEFCRKVMFNVLPVSSPC
jgi:hypothetical protein